MQHNEMILSAVCFSAVLVSVSLSKQCKHDLAVQVQCKCSAGAFREQLEDNVPRLVGICHPPSCSYLVITSGHSIFFNSKSSDNDAVDADTTKMKTIMILNHAMETCLQAGFEVVSV